MKQIYTILNICLITVIGYSQNYEFGIVHNTGYNFSIVALPDIASTTTTDVSDIGFALMLPAGTADVINETQFSGRSWTVNQYTGATLMGYGLGDGSRDAFVINLPPGATGVAHGAGQQIVLINFDISNTPSTGLLEVLSNSDPIVIGLGGAADSFYNVNLEGLGIVPPGTTNQFSGLAAGMENFMFSTLSLEEEIITDNSISVYPNPVKDILNIATENTAISYSLFNVLGQQVRINGSLNSNTTKSISISELPDGIYILKTEDENNKFKKSFKIIKKK